MLHLQLIKPKCQLFCSNLNLPPKLILCPNKVWWNKITVTGTFSVHTESRILHKFAFFQLADAFIQITFNENNTSGNNYLKKNQFMQAIVRTQYSFKNPSNFWTSQWIFQFRWMFWMNLSTEWQWMWRFQKVTLYCTVIEPPDSIHSLTTGDEKELKCWGKKVHK